MPEINLNNSDQENQELKDYNLSTKLQQREELLLFLDSINREIKLTQKDFIQAGKELKPLLYPEENLLNTNEEGQALKESISNYDRLMLELEKSQFRAAKIESSLENLENRLIETLDNGADESIIESLIERRDRLIEKFIDTRDQQAFIESEAQQLNEQIRNQLENTDEENIADDRNLAAESLLNEKLEDYTSLAQFLNFLNTEKENLETELTAVNSEIEIITRESPALGEEIANTKQQTDDSNNVSLGNTGETENQTQITRNLLNELLEQQDYSEDLITEILKANEAATEKKTAAPQETTNSQPESSAKSASERTDQKEAGTSGSQSEELSSAPVEIDLSRLTQLPKTGDKSKTKKARKTNNPALKTPSKRRQSI